MAKFSINQSSKKKRSWKRVFFACCVTSVLILGIAVILSLMNIIKLPFFTDNESVDFNDTAINYGPPTNEEKKASDTTKTNMPSTPISVSPPKNEPVKQTTTPVIVSINQESDTKNVAARGLVPGIFETGGSCTLTLSRADQVVSESRSTVLDAQSTTCGKLEILRSKLSAGTWSAVLSYSSSTHQGSSTSTLVEVL